MTPYREKCGVEQKQKLTLTKSSDFVASPPDQLTPPGCRRAQCYPGVDRCAQTLKMATDLGPTQVDYYYLYAASEKLSN